MVPDIQIKTNEMTRQKFEFSSDFYINRFSGVKNSRNMWNEIPKKFSYDLLSSVTEHLKKYLSGYNFIGHCSYNSTSADDTKYNCSMCWCNRGRLQRGKAERISYWFNPNSWRKWMDCFCCWRIRSALVNLRFTSVHDFQKNK